MGRGWRAPEGAPAVAISFWQSNTCKRFLKTAIYVGMVFTFSVGAAAIADQEKPPHERYLAHDPSLVDFLLMLLVVMSLSGAIATLLPHRREGGERHARPRASNLLLDTWRSDERSQAYVLGIRWVFSGWRLWTFGMLLAIDVAACAVLATDPRKRSAMWDMAGLKEFIFTTAIAGAVFAWILILKGREVRRGKERIKVADEYLALREERLHREFDVMCQKLVQQQQDWKAEKMAEMYQQILDQQARGLLPCPNCEGHRKSA